MKCLKLAAALTIATLCSISTAQDWARNRLNASPRHLEWVDVRHGERIVKTLVAYPERAEKAPIVILIHEIFGMTDWVESMADQLAEAGFIALAPDLLSGMGPAGGRSSDFKDVTEAREAVGNLDPAQVTADLRAVLSYGRSIPSSNGKVFTSGFCWGGTQCFRFATEQSGLTASFVFYGSAPTDKESLSKIEAPVYGFYAGRDNRINATLDDTKRMMSDAGKSFEAVIYEGAGHGFMRSGEMPDAEPVNSAGRSAAWDRWLKAMYKL